MCAWTWGIISLDPFEIQYLPHISLTRGDIVHMTVPAGHAIIFTDACLHAGGVNNSTKTLFQLFGYMVSTLAQFPVNQVFKYNWNGASDDMAAGMVQANVGQKTLKRNIFKSFCSPVNRYFHLSMHDVNQVLSH